MIFKLNVLLTVAVLSAGQWGGGFCVKAKALPPPAPVHVIKMLEPIAQIEFEPIAPLELADYPTAPAGTYANTYAPANCTWYVASMKQIPGSWGNAATWADRAAADGITVSPVPVDGSIAQHAGGLGHVAVVRAISGDMVLIDEMNYDWQGSVRQDWQPVADYVYIYI